MRLHYSDPLIKIYEGDTREVLGHLPAFDLAIADPPSNHGLTYGDKTDDARPYEEYRAWCKEWFSVLLRKARTLILLPTRKNEDMWHTIRRPLRVEHFPLMLRNAKIVGEQPMFVYGVSREVETYIVTSLLEGDGSNPLDSPVSWYEGIFRIVKPLSFLDPFMGTGSSMIAARRMEVPTTGIEIEHEYCARAVSRLVEDAEIRAKAA